MLTCLLNRERINCYDGKYSKEQLKKWANKKILLCPACRKPYEYCHGKVKSPYFRHMDKTECEDRYSEPETEEHINGKKDLYEWIKKQPGVTDCELEGWISGTKQRPDIMFKYKGRQYVLEYQCSPIATEYLERHELYQAAGIKDIWIAGYEKYFKPNSRHKFLENHIHGYYNVQEKKFYLRDYEQEYAIHFCKKLFNKYKNDNFLNSFIFRDGKILFYCFKNQDYRLILEKRNNRKELKNAYKKIDKENFIKRIDFIKKNLKKCWVTVNYPNYWNRDLFIRFNRDSSNTIKYENSEQIYLKINNFFRIEKLNKKLKQFNKNTNTWSFYLHPNSNTLDVRFYDDRGYYLHKEEKELTQDELFLILDNEKELKKLLVQIMKRCKNTVINSRNNDWKVISYGGK